MTEKEHSIFILNNLSIAVVAIYLSYFTLMVAIVMGLFGVYTNPLSILMLTFAAYCLDQHLIYLGDKYKDEFDRALFIVKNDDT